MWSTREVGCPRARRGGGGVRDFSDVTENGPPQDKLRVTRTHDESRSWRRHWRAGNTVSEYNQRFVTSGREEPIVFQSVSLKPLWNRCTNLELNIVLFIFITHNYLSANTTPNLTGFLIPNIILYNNVNFYSLYHKYINYETVCAQHKSCSTKHSHNLHKQNWTISIIKLKGLRVSMKK